MAQTLARPRSERRPTWARDPVLLWIARAESSLARWLAVLGLVATGASGVAMLGRGSGPDAPLLGFVVGALTLPFVPALWLASKGVREGWPYGWALQALPPAVWVGLALVWRVIAV